MADDTRQNTESVPTQNAGEQASEQLSKSKPKYERPQSQVGKLWEAFGNPDESANMLPTASGKKANDITVTEAMKSMSLKDAASFYKAPCARDSLLLGIGAGFGVGGVRGVLGGKYTKLPLYELNWLNLTFKFV